MTRSSKSLGKAVDLPVLPGPRDFAGAGEIMILDAGVFLLRPRDCAQLGSLPFFQNHVKAHPRKMKVHSADRRVFVSDDDFIDGPGQDAPYTGLP